jgi:hypothetical protein
MATAHKEGDRVRIVDREATADDVKSGLFYNHFRNLSGTIQKIYGEEAAIEIETTSLAEGIARRHEDVQEQMKSKWLDGLSEEARNRLTDQERDFRLRYTILVATKDLIAEGKSKGEGGRMKDDQRHSTDSPRRATSNDLTAAEEAELRRRQAARKE